MLYVALSNLDAATFQVVYYSALPVYANYIGLSVMTDANCEGFPIWDHRITENDRCVIKIIGIHWLSPKSDIPVILIMMCIHDICNTE